MERKAAIQIALALFATYPTVDAFHITTDGQAFEEPQNAESHARSLDKKNPTVVTIKRGEKATDENVGKLKTAAAGTDAGDSGVNDKGAGGDEGAKASNADAGNADAGAAVPKAPKAKGGKK